MAVPARRTSKTKKRMRRTHLKKEVETTSVCPNCGAVIKPHRVCSECGFYKGKEAVASEKEEVKVEEKPKKAKAKAKKETKKETKEDTK